MMPRTPLWIVVAAILCCVTGCRKDEGGSSSKDVTNGPVSEIDRLRSLPYAGFTEEPVDEGRQGVVVYDRERSYPGYNLASLRALCSAELIDATGEVLHVWERLPGRRWANVALLPGGDLLVIGADGSLTAKTLLRDEDRYLLRLTWESETIWMRRITAHHDLQLTPTDNILVLTMTTRLIPEVHPVYETRDNELTLLTADGGMVSQRSLYEAMSAAPSVFQFQPVASGLVPFVDLFHANSVDRMHHKHLEAKHPMYASGNILVSIRHQDTVAIIDWARNKVVWSWGQGEISGPHDATVLENGNILLFDNGLGRLWSRVIELNPLTKKIVWEYKAPSPTDFYSASRGAAQRLPNGNTLITNSDSGQAFEVTINGEIVWEYLTPHTNHEGRRAVIGWMRRYELDYVDNIRKKFDKNG